jgi:hypothetical protein
MAFEHLQPGDRIKPTAFEFNAMLDAGRALAGVSGIAPAGIEQKVPPNWVKVKNITGRALRRYTGYRLGPCLWELTGSGNTIVSGDKGGTTLGENVYELTDNASPTNRPVAVIQQPLANNAIGWAAVSGVTLVKVLAVVASGANKPLDYAGISPNHDATEPGFDGAFRPGFMGGELHLLTAPVAGSGVGINDSMHCYALAEFVAGGIRSQSWTARNGASAGLADSLTGVNFGGNAEMPPSADATGFTGWEKVTYNTNYEAWKCKRAGIWRVTTTAYSSLTGHNSGALTIGEFVAAVVRNRSGEARLDHGWGQVTMNVAAVEHCHCFVDYIAFALDDLLTIRPSGKSVRATALTTTSVNDQALVDMEGQLSAELVTRHWSATDREPLYEALPPEE